ncbi:T9SS type A sorting domain-containing protein [Seonamhaeicola sp. NFXS20]|uniref:T9SS type A sorting domain-containing protein n=1 Tax=Seonamhaeicola sp. NFXS20 TaxID=2816959 RepID=UPI003B8DE6CF
MKKTYLTATALFITSLTFAQHAFVIDNFEFDPTPNYITTGDYFNNSKSYFGVTSQNEADVDVDRAGVHFFGAQQLNAAPHILSYNPIDISGVNELTVAFAAAEDDANVGEDWDANDDKVTFQYKIDNGVWQNIFVFTGSGTDTAPQLDTNFDGVGDGTILTDEMQDFDAVIYNSGGAGEKLYFQIVFEGLTEEDEDFALSYFNIIAEPDLFPNPSITSPSNDAQYPNGTGSVTINYHIDNTADAAEIWANDLKIADLTTLTGNGSFSLPVSDNMGYDYTIYVLVDGYVVESASRYLQVGDPLSVKNNEIEGFSIYPNPVRNNKFTISSANSNASKEVKLYNILGALVLNKTINNKQSINVSNLTTGVYVLRVTENNKTAARKLIIK